LSEEVIDMCYDTNARPPVPPGGGQEAKGQDLELTAQDGNRFAAYLACSSSPSGAQVLIYPDVRGLHGFYKDLALRFAQKGVDALAIDYFGRTAGLTARDDSFEYMPHVQQLQWATLMADARAGLEYLRKDGQRSVFTVGFCMGGTISLMSGAQEDLGLAGVVGFYAGVTRDFGTGRTVLEQASDIKCPVLGLFGGADQGIPEEKVRELDRKLEEAGVEHDIVLYPGTPHSFFDRKYEEFAQESADAWTRVLGFIEGHTARVGEAAGAGSS
jgi:carboxymethylenebutenolidase